MKNLNKYYIEQKEKKFKKLEEMKLKLSQEIEKEEGRLKINRESLEKLKFENTLLKDQYSRLKAMIIDRGIVLDVDNNNYKIYEWDNLNIEKKRDEIFILSKYGEELYSLKKDTVVVFKELFSEGYSCSLVAIRVTAKLIKVQLRFRK